MRKRLIELLDDVHCAREDAPYQEIHNREELADYLLANGVILPPCKVGDKVYYITGIHGKLVGEAKVEELYYNGDGFAYRVSSDYLYFDMQAEEIFFTKEEAEYAIKLKHSVSLIDGHIEE